MRRFLNDAPLLARSISEEFPQCRIIAVDGWDGAGKTTLAVGLAHELGCSHYDLDADANAAGTKTFLTAERLSKAGKIIRSISGPVVVSGVMVRKFLERLSIEIDVNIYVKRMAQWGWADHDKTYSWEFACEFGESSELTREIFDYHQQYQPHLNAEFVFLRLA